MFLFCSFHQLSIDMYFYIILTKNKPSILGYLNVSYFFKNQNKFGWLKFNCSHFGFCKFFPCRLTVLFKLSKILCFFLFIFNICFSVRVSLGHIFHFRPCKIRHSNFEICMGKNCQNKFLYSSEYIKIHLRFYFLGVIGSVTSFLNVYQNSIFLFVCFSYYFFKKIFKVAQLCFPHF